MPRFTSTLVLFLFCILLLRNYLGFSLSSSLWLDETITAWVIASDLQEVFRRALEYQGQSPLYFLLLWFYHSGEYLAEWQLRLPSVVFALIALFGLVGCARELFPKQTTVGIPLFALACTPFIKSAINARPYALVLLGVFLSTYFFLRLLRKARWWDWPLYLVTISLAFYAHYLSLLLLIFHLALFFLVDRKERKIGIFQVCLLLLFMTALFFPGITHFLDVVARGELYRYPQPITGNQILRAVLVPEFLIPFGFSLIVARIFFPLRFSLSWSYRVLFCIAWFLLPPLVFLLLSVIKGENLFFVRFFEWHLGGLVILSAYLVGSIQERKAQSLIFAVFTVIQLLVPRAWNIENWKEIAHAVRTGDSVTVVYTGLIELESDSFRADPRNRDYLLAPFHYYPVSERLVISSSAFETEVPKAVLQGEHVLTLVSPKMVKFSDPNYRGGVSRSLDQKIQELGFQSKLVIDSQVQLFRYESTKDAP